MRTCVSIFWLLSMASLYAQGDSLTLFKSIPIQAELFSTDPVGNLYIVEDENQIIKYSPSGDSLGIFNEIRTGRVTQIDASNPLRILVFYSDYGQISILDNMMSLKNTLNLKRIGLYNVPCIANSLDGNIWVFDPNGQLLKIDEELNVRFEMPLRNIIEANLSPCYMREYNRQLYMLDSLEGIYRFDRYGFYMNRYNFFPKEIQLIDNYIIYEQGGFMHSYQARTIISQKIAIPQPESIRMARLERDQVYVLRDERLDIYKLHVEP